jgi:hypothetical protein
MRQPAGRARRTAIVTMGVFAVSGLAACGSNSPSKSESIANPTTTTSSTPAQQSGGVGHLISCLTSAGWAVKSVTVLTGAARALHSLSGFQSLIDARGPHGAHASIAVFQTPADAARAQVTVGPLVPGHGHATSPASAPFAWINYSGSPRVDEAIGNCI